MVRWDTAVFSESLVKAYQSKDGERGRDARREMREEERAVLPRHLALLGGQQQAHPHPPLAEVLHRSIAFPGRHPSNRAAHSECCFVHPALPT